MSSLGTHRMIIFATLAWSGTGVAAILHVGTGCQYSTLAAAVAAAKTNAGADTIAITGNLSITSTVTVRDANALTIEGGYASCSATTSNGTHSTLDANSLSTTSSAIHQDSDDGSGNDLGGNLTLRHLNIRNANSNIDPGDDLYGGAIYANLGTSKSGTLNLVDVSIDHNKAGEGAGLWIEGSDQTHAKLNVTDSLFEYNNANFDGGGIHAGKTDVAIKGDTEITINTAVNGGGIYAENSNIDVTGHTRSDKNFLGSNSADYGGGLYATAAAYGGGDFHVTMQNDRSDQPLTVENNSANFVGGGFYLKTSTDPSTNLKNTIQAHLWNMIFRTNMALDGRAAALFIYADNNQSVTHVYMKQTDPGSASPPPCASGLACNALDSNSSSSSSSFDSIVHLDTGPTRAGIASFELVRGRLRDNLAQWSLIRGDGDVSIDNSLIASNQITQSAMFAMDHDHLVISNTTIADNSMQTNQSVAYYDSGTLLFLHNLVDQPFHHVCWPATLATSAPQVVDLGVTANTISAECNGTNVQQGSPAFVDPGNADPLQRDFHLKFNSQAIDRWTPATSSNSLIPTVDLDGYPRPYFKLASYPYDFGAYEYGSERIFANGFEP